MELFIFIVFQLLMEVQSYKSPAVKVFVNVLSESSSVNIRCETPADVTVDQCNYYPNSKQENIKVSWTCELELSGAEVLKWADVKSPASVDIYCFYIRYEHNNTPSSHSPAATVKVRAGRKSGADHVIKVEMSESQTVSDKSIKVSTTANTAHITTTAMTTSLTVRSTSESTTYSKTVDLPSKTNLPTNTTKETMFFTATSTLPGNRNMSEHDTWVIVLVSTGVGVILTGFICLCWFASKKRRKHNKIRLIRSDEPSQGIGLSCSGPAETYSLITSVPATSQPISVGLKHPESHQDSTPDPTATNSSIMSENSIYQPSEVLVNTQQKQGNTEENENIYHLYCTIPDKPVHSNAGDQVYSLVKMH